MKEQTRFRVKAKLGHLSYLPVKGMLQQYVPLGHRPSEYWKYVLSEEVKKWMLDQFGVPFDYFLSCPKELKGLILDYWFKARNQEFWLIDVEVIWTTEGYKRWHAVAITLLKN